MSEKLGKRYIAVSVNSIGQRRVAKSYGGAESMYQSPGMARRYGGKDCVILEIDLDGLPEAE